ncbi:MAG: hypothetical protein QOG73_3933 [Acetobacteraceae bacterium]|nr:hypothetical protein [Acetobacteraceae bacterium]
MLRSSLVGAAAIVCFSLSNSFAQTNEVKPGHNAPLQVETTIPPERFAHSNIVDNKWAPMKPGTRWTYEGTSREDDGKIVPHRIIVTVTDLTKTLGGIRTVVSYDLDYSDGELVEAELAFYAQDNFGNVWQFGEYPEEYEDGKFIKAPTWIHGLRGARAGIMMPADPQTGKEGFSEGWGPAVGWKDRGIVYQIGQKVIVPAGVFEGVLVIKESATGEKDAEQLKYYASGTGNVRTGWLGSAAQATETLELVKVEQLDRRALLEVSQKALQLEKAAYKRSKDVYSKTPHSVAGDDRGLGTR